MALFQPRVALCQGTVLVIPPCRAQRVFWPASLSSSLILGHGPTQRSLTEQSKQLGVTTLGMLKKETPYQDLDARCWHNQDRGFGSLRLSLRKKHRTMEWFGLEWTLKATSFQTLKAVDPFPTVSSPTLGHPSGATVQKQLSPQDKPHACFLHTDAWRCWHRAGYGHQMRTRGLCRLSYFSQGWKTSKRPENKISRQREEREGWGKQTNQIKKTPTKPKKNKPHQLMNKPKTQTHPAQL